MKDKNCRVAKRSGEMLCLVYEGGKSFFSYDRRVGEASGNMVDDPVFLVLTKANITNMERSGLVRSGVGFPLKLPIGEQEATQPSKIGRASCRERV